LLTDRHTPVTGHVRWPARQAMEKVRAAFGLSMMSFLIQIVLFGIL
jgi:hypothetical protein